MIGTAAIQPPVAGNRNAIFLAVMMTVAGFALTVLAFYPGYMTNDAGFVYSYAREWRFEDWQSPLMSMIWWLIDPIAPGPASMFLLIAALYWLAFGMLAATLARYTFWLGIAVPILALAPPAFMLLSMIWRDVLFAVIWLNAAVIACAAAKCGRPLRLCAQLAAIALVGLGILLRPNAIGAAPFLFAYVLWPQRFDWKRTAVLFLPAVVAGYGLIYVTYYKIIDVERKYPERQVVVYDLGGITHFTKQNQFPIAWMPEQDALLTSTCYSPLRWDVYWTMAPCDFVMKRIRAEGLFNSPQLVRAWIDAILTHPLAYLRHRATFMATFLAGGSNLTLELFRADDPAHTPLASNRYFKLVLGWYEALKSSVLFRPGFWIVLAALVCALGWRWRATAAGAFAIGVTSSAIVYVLSFFPIGVATDFRYGYWAVLATLAGLAALVAAWWEAANAPQSPPDVGDSPEAA